MHKAIFIDLTKIFYIVNRDGLLVILKRLGGPVKFTRITELFHEHMIGQVLSNGSASDTFEFSIGMKRVCACTRVLQLCLK